MSLQNALHKCPLIPILNGITPDDVLPIVEVLVDIGFQCIEIPLSAPNAFNSIERLAGRFSGKILIGAGAVTEVEQIDIVMLLKVQVVMMAHTDPNIIHKSKQKGLFCIPGFSTPTEAFNAVYADADALKLFPPSAPGILKILRTVLPEKTYILPTGGIGLDSMPHYWEAGARGFGIDTQLYQAGDSVDEVGKKAKQFYNLIQSLV